MKIGLIIAITIITVSVRAISPAIADSPAETASYYYHWYGGELGIGFAGQDFTKLPKPVLSLYRYTPSREHFNVMYRTGYDGLENYLHFSKTASLRYSALYLAGGSIETGFNFRKKSFHLNPTAAFMYKKTGNIDYSVNNDLQLGMGRKFDIANRLRLSAGFNPDRLNRFVFSLHSTPDISMSWNKIFGKNLTRITISTDNLFTSRRRLNLLLSYGRRTDKDGLLTEIDVNRYYKQTVSYHRRYGEYSPPITYSATMFPLVNEPKIRHGLSLMKMKDSVPSADIIITVRRGDNLNRISRRLPAEADDLYRNNIGALGSYNNIRPPYTLHPGQQLRIPPRQFTGVQQSLPDLEDRELRKINDAISSSRISDLMEVRLNAALWAGKVSGSDEMNAILPVRADIENRYLLNTQSIAEIDLRNPKSAIRKLLFAIEIDPHCVILNTNLGIAYYLDNNMDEARKYILQGRDYAEEYGIDTDFHDSIMNELLNR